MDIKGSHESKLSQKYMQVHKDNQPMKDLYSYFFLASRRKLIVMLNIIQYIAFAICQVL